MQDKLGPRPVWLILCLRISGTEALRQLDPKSEGQEPALVSRTFPQVPKKSLRVRSVMSCARLPTKTVVSSLPPSAAGLRLRDRLYEPRYLPPLEGGGEALILFNGSFGLSLLG